MEQLNHEQLKELKLLLNSKLFQVFKKFLADRQEAHESSAMSYSENLMTLLLREQALGAAAECRVIWEEFLNHVDQQIKNTQPKDKV